MNAGIISYLVTFLLGAATGATGSYFASKYTDLRRRKEANSQLSEVFENVRAKMPSLIEEMRNDLKNPENQLKREFFLVRKNNMLMGNGTCLAYYYEDHNNLQDKIHILENSGFVTDVTPGNAPKYRMIEEFVELVLRSK